MSKISTAHPLSYADFIISLNAKGQVVEQGSREALVSIHDYASTLVGESEIVDSIRAPAPAPDFVFDDDALGEVKRDEDLDLQSRQTGDWSVYRYYFENMGWPLLFLALVCSVLFMFGLIFPRTCALRWLDDPPVKLVYQKSGSNGGLALMRNDQMKILHTG